MKDLLTGIYTKFSSTPNSSFYGTVGGDFYFEQAPTSAQFPYATYHLSNDGHQWTFNSDYEVAMVDFNLFSDSTGGALEITQMYERLKAVYDDCVLTVSGHSFYRFRRMNAWVNLESEMIPNKSIWQYTVEYEVLIRQNT